MKTPVIIGICAALALAIIAIIYSVNRPSPTEEVVVDLPVTGTGADTFSSDLNAVIEEAYQGASQK